VLTWDFDAFQVESPDHTYSAPDDRDNIWVFRKHNFTLAIYWSPYLVHVEDKEIRFSSDNKTQTVAFIHVDRLDEMWVDRIRGVDILQLSTGMYESTTICSTFLYCEKKLAPFGNGLLSV
jgi:hypothetical protein